MKDLQRKQWGRMIARRDGDKMRRRKHILEGLAIGLVLLVVGYGVVIVWSTVPDNLPVVEQP